MSYKIENGKQYATLAWEVVKSDNGYYWFDWAGYAHGPYKSIEAAANELDDYAERYEWLDEE